VCVTKLQTECKAVFVLLVLQTQVLLYVLIVLEIVLQESRLALKHSEKTVNALVK